MAPPMAARAPVTPTPAYTRLFTKRVAGLVMEEKKVARRDAFSSRSFTSSNRSSDSFSWEKACTTFWLPIISSIMAVCSPLVSD